MRDRPVEDHIADYRTIGRQWGITTPHCRTDGCEERPLRHSTRCQACQDKYLKVKKPRGTD